MAFELDINLNLAQEKYWLRSGNLLKLNPSGELPIITDLSGLVVCGIYPVTEYLNDVSNNYHLISQDPQKAAEIRRIFFWFNNKFYKEVTKWIIDEKLIRLLAKLGNPRTEYIRTAKDNFAQHMKYISQLLKTRNCLAHDKISLADIAAASHISVLDYFGEIAWHKYPDIKEWYSLIKSRPGFHSLLQDHIPGFQPPRHYKDLDF